MDMNIKIKTLSFIPGIIGTFLIFLLCGGLVRGIASAQAQNEAAAPSSREDLENLIKLRSQELEKVNRELGAVQENLRQTQSERATLQRELKTLDQNINQLTLNITADEIAGQKLGFEINSLQFDIGDIERSIDDKKTAIIYVLRELQKKNGENLMVIFLRNTSIADSILETQTLANLKSQLDLDIHNLTTLQETLHMKLGQIQSKKSEVELRQRNLVARKSLVQDQKEERQVILTQTKSKETLYEQQLAELKKQQDAISDAIEKVEDQLRTAFDPSILPAKRSGVFAWPIPLAGHGGTGRITQHFGERSYLYRGKPHNGLDIGVPIGTPIFAADDGVVMAVDNNDKSRWNKYQYGKYVLIRHANNLATLYAHLSQYIVSSGQAVKRGDLLGYSGNTGYATGPHLHFGAYWAPSVVMKSIPPAAGLVPIGVALAPEGYL